MESPPPAQQPPNLPLPRLLDEQRRLKPPIRILMSRSYTIIVLWISIILLFALKNTDKVTGAPPPMPAPQNKGTTGGARHTPPPPPPDNDTQPTFKISELGSIRSVLTVSVIGAGCNLFQLGMLIYCMVTGRNLTRNKYNIFFNYYSDKVVALLLAASAGAGLGSMLDIKQVRPSFKYVGSFLSLGKISTTLLVSAMVSMSVSSAYSSKAMLKYKMMLEKREKTAGMLGPWATKAYNFCCCQ
ncbi:hypothetical protein V2J09_008281 [Rumex salicifolius]